MHLGVLLQQNSGWYNNILATVLLFLQKHFQYLHSWF
uniref:Uncharacterized protein n=1 Tax=Arundo donax TaxID=35708 RepID=A0A0A8Y1R1_ARUDO